MKGFSIRNRFNLSLLLLLCASGVFQGCAASRPARLIDPDQAALDQLRAGISAVLAQPALAQTTVGLKVVSLPAGEVLFAKNPYHLFHPASTTKLFTAVAALRSLGTDYRFRTIVYADSAAEVTNGTLASSVYLRGNGDPLLNTADLRDLADQIARQEVRTITADLVADDTCFDDLRLGTGWMWDDVEYDYSAPISGLTVNKNCVTVVVTPGRAVGDTVAVRLEPPTSYVQVRVAATTGPSDSLSPSLRVEREWVTRQNLIVVQGRLPLGSTERRVVRTVEDPTRYAAVLFRELLAERGVIIKGGIRLAPVPTGAREVAVHLSEPLTAAIQHMLKISDNLTAEHLIKTIGAHVSGPPGTADTGLRAVRRFLTETVGLDTLRYVLADGSGLSWYNLVSPSQVVDLLTQASQDSLVLPSLMAALPIAGQDGTLRSRMVNSPAQGRLSAKTGSLSGVSCLSGFVTTLDGERLVFSIMMNHFPGNTLAHRQAQDEIGALLATFSRRRQILDFGF